MNSQQLGVSRLESIFNYISQFRVKYVRNIMSVMRDPTTDVNTFLPHLGITLGEFCIAYVINMRKK